MMYISCTSVIIALKKNRLSLFTWIVLCVTHTLDC